INDLTDGKILAYAIGSGGTPSAVSGSPFTVPSNDQPENLAIDSGGRFLYAPVIQGGIVAFSVNGSTGALTEIAGSPFSTSDQPFTLAIAPSAKYLYSIGATSNSAIDAFEIDAETGALSVVQGSPFAAPSALNSLTVDSSGSYLYATAQVDMQANSCLYGYAIDPATGGLTALATSPYPAPTFPVNALSLSIP
ncbi:MAG: beta-propeller fold lactonase family protein, partial [Candidatus Acidiferrales bacterium]